MPGSPFRRGERVALHPVLPTDHEFVADHWTTPEVRHGFGYHDPKTPADVADLLETPDASHFLVCRDGDPVGFLWLFHVDDVAGRAEMGYWIAPGEQGQGYATAAAELGVEYAFEERGLRKVSARVFDWNEGSRRVLEKLGFEAEGHLREHYFVDGEHVDADLFALFADER